MDEQQNEQLVLTAVERAACERVARGEAPQAQRAQAILALGDGATLADAAAQSGLTENQVKLWRGRFRNGRLSIFPEESLAVADTPVATPIPVTIESLPALAIAAKEEPVKKEKKKDGDGRKKKEDKGKKKDKNKKKDKKGKKEKKKKK
jgi:transposase-like protein